MSEHPRLALSELHLAAEAIVAYLDGELAPGPEQRATAHLEHCGECRAVLAAQRQAKSMLHQACAPRPAADLLTRLRNIPIEADLPGPGGPGMTLAMHGDQIVWQRERPAQQPEPVQPPHGFGHNPWHLTLGRGLAGAAAAVMVGMLAVTTPSSASGSGPGGPTTPARPATVRPPAQPVQTTNVVTASVPHVLGGEQPVLQPRPDTDSLPASPRL